MKRITILLIAIVGTFFNAQAATAPDGVDLNINIAEKVIQQIGYDWYAENFQGECEVILNFKMDENQNIILNEVSSSDPSVTKYLTRKLNSFSVPSNGSTKGAMSLKMTFEEE